MTDPEPSWAAEMRVIGLRKLEGVEGVECVPECDNPDRPGRVVRFRVEVASADAAPTIHAEIATK